METGGVVSAARLRGLDEKQILMEETRTVSLRDACSHDLRPVRATGPGCEKACGNQPNFM
jgi:hypothetical protein